MFAKTKKTFELRWNHYVDTFLFASDSFFEWVGLFKKKSMTFATQSSLVQPGSRSLLKFTFLGLLVALMCVLFSCQTMPKSQKPKAPVLQSATEKSPEMLYVKRDSTQIKPTESGSRTGSLWADATSPRALFSEPRPTRMGEVVTVNIPETLQFQWTPTTAKPGATAATDGTKNGSEGNALEKTNEKLQGAQQNMYEPLRSFKMEIVAMDGGGFSYLRGTRFFRDVNNDQKQVTLFAKVPTSSLTSFQVEAPELSEVALSEMTNGATSDYSAPGWDLVVSRKISGFTPDLNTEFAAVEDVRNELKGIQKGLEERQKALSGEAERLRKDRERLSREQENFTKNAKAGEGSSEEGAKPK